MLLRPEQVASRGLPLTGAITPLHVTLAEALQELPVHPVSKGLVVLRLIVTEVPDATALLGPVSVLETPVQVLPPAPAVQLADSVGRVGEQVMVPPPPPEQIPPEQVPPLAQ